MVVGDGGRRSATDAKSERARKKIGEKESIFVTLIFYLFICCFSKKGVKWSLVVYVRSLVSIIG